MTVSISRPEILAITDETSQSSSFGCNQNWYADKRQRMAGCGPTCAANIMAYLALSRSELRALYSGDVMTKAQISIHMDEIYKFVTPGNMGLNRLEVFTRGVEDFAFSRGLYLRTHVFEVRGKMSRNRLPVSELTEFVHASLANDCPVAFLNLDNGRVNNIQSWHWVTITSANIADKNDTNLSVCASDEGLEVCFDLKQWYMSTRLRGGLVYFTAK
ncbi:hypothetical protein FACS18948_2390 [Clostridia bacterium]|nr:hypothetical protein FACS18948_2390 [Clostridia bacterium]